MYTLSEFRIPNTGVSEHLKALLLILSTWQAENPNAYGSADVQRPSPDGHCVKGTTGLSPRGVNLGGHVAIGESP